MLSQYIVKDYSCCFKMLLITSLYRVANYGDRITTIMSVSRVFNIPLLPSEFDTYQNAVIPIMVAKQAEYNILISVVTNLEAMKEKWDAYVLICDTDSTKGMGATANRNGYQPKYLNAIESAISIYLLNNYDILAADLITFHISTPSKNRKPTPAATSTVVGKVKYKEPLAHYLSFTDTVSGKKAKPKGVGYIELHYMIGTEPPTSVDDCHLTTNITWKKKKVQFTAADEGKKAYYYGRYVNQNGNCGAWCKMFSGAII